VGTVGIDQAPPVSYPVGASPYHKKGILYTGCLTYIDEQVPGGTKEVVKTLPPELQAFFGQTFLAAAWYDFLPCLRLYSVAARVSGLTTVRFLGAFAAWQAREQAQSINRLMLSAGSIEAVAARQGGSFNRSFDFAEVVTLRHSANSASRAVRQLPHFLFDWYRYSMQPAATAVLALAGARDQQVAYTATEPDGEDKGVPLVRFEIHRSWK